MKPSVIPTVSVLSAMLLGACDTPSKPPRSQTSHLPPPTQTLVDPNVHAQEAQVTPPPSEPSKPKTETKPINPVPNPPTVQGKLPYGKPVPGKPGFVFSPYEQYKGYIDVRGFPPGTEVKDPYSDKIFLVP